ncbi:MauE/DoxX family redox-associated membrane protein [Kitasatospora sp. NPDC054939]
MTAYLLLAARCVIAAVFAASALGKLRAPGEFAAALRGMEVVPDRLAGATAVAVPLVEVALALLVWASEPLTTWGFVLSAGLIALFVGVLVSVLRRGIDASCSCFGSSTAPVGRAHVVRNLVLLAVAATGLAASATGAGAPAEAAGAALAVLAGLFTAALVVATDTLVDLFSGLRPDRRPVG